MATAHPLRVRLTERMRELPSDLVGVLVLTVLTNGAVALPLIRDTPIRIVLGLPFVVFVPGYVLVAVLFPETSEPRTADGDGETYAQEGFRSDPFWRAALVDDLDGFERVAFSVFASVVVVPLVGLSLIALGYPLSLVPILVGVSAVTVVLTLVAIGRRLALPADRRFRVPLRAWITSVRTELYSPTSRGDAVLTVLLVASILLTAGVAGFGLATGPPEDEFSSIYVLTVDEDDDGDERLVADGYPETVALDDPESIVVGVDNREHRSVEYTVVVVEQHAEVTDDETIVHEQRERDRFEPTLDHDETWLNEHLLEPTFVGEDVRYVWLLYVDGDVPDDPSTANADRYAYLWIDVGETDEEVGEE